MTHTHKQIQENTYVRELTVFDSEELRAIRLESLKSYGQIFDNFYAHELSRPISYWEEQSTQTSDHCFFGLFAYDELIGIMASRRWENDVSGRTAFWWSNYTKPAFRGLGLTRDLYQKRINWSQKNGMNHATAYVLDSAKRPQKILENLGGRITYEEDMSFFGGPCAKWKWYRVPLLPALATGDAGNAALTKGLTQTADLVGLAAPHHADGKARRTAGG